MERIVGWMDEVCMYCLFYLKQQGEPVYVSMGIIDSVSWASETFSDGIAAADGIWRLKKNELYDRACVRDCY